MAGDMEITGMGGFPRCDVCQCVVRVRGVGNINVWCKKCIGGALPFMGIEGEIDYRGAIKEYREGLQSRAADFQGLRFDPFGEEERETLGKVNGALKGCEYTTGDKLQTRLKGLAKYQGCALSLLFHHGETIHRQRQH